MKLIASCPSRLLNVPQQHRLCILHICISLRQQRLARRLAMLIHLGTNAAWWYHVQCVHSESRSTRKGQLQNAVRRQTVCRAAAQPNFTPAAGPLKRRQPQLPRPAPHVTLTDSQGVKRAQSTPCLPCCSHKAVRTPAPTEPHQVAATECNM